MKKHSFYLPPQWHHQSGVMLTWPHKYSDWAPILEDVDCVFTNIARAISRYETVVISCFDEAHKRHIQQLLHDSNNIQFFIVKSNDSWVRDHGPITVFDENKRPILLDFQFNAWGNKYASEKDNQLTQTLFKQGAFAGVCLKSLNIILEGGSIDVNGKGSLLTTTSCLLSESRNNITREDYAEIFSNYFGVDTIYWLEHGHLLGDDTDGHIDTLARFIDENSICYVNCEDKQEPHYEALQKMRQQLEHLKSKFNLIPLPLPEPQYNQHGDRLPATYANFLIINNAVLVPTYHAKTDITALNIFQTCFPNRDIIGIDCRALIKQFGSLHCVTMQLPANILKRFDQ